jgi:uncharacterized protein YndB with AHSA1/START domain
MADTFSTTVTINAAPATVWSVLTDPKLMAAWMGEPGMKLEVETNWKVNSQISIRGFHHVKFENKGTILKYVKEQIVSYSHLSSVSRLPDSIENYSVLEFVLTPINKQTTLALTITNFPTEAIQKHLAFYWRGTIYKIKEFAEMMQQDKPSLEK